MVWPLRRVSPPLLFFLNVVAGYLLLSVWAGIMLVHASLHMPRREMDEAAVVRAALQSESGSGVEDVSITASDGAVMRGWYVRPRAANGKSVVMLHGVHDNRIGISGFAQMFLAQGYAVLLPDSRAHGESGGDTATYGVLERDDVRRWVVWARTRDAGCTYLFGESMGAAIGLQATAVAPQLCAVAVESPFSTFRRTAIERLGWLTHLGPGFWATLGRPAIEFAILWARLRDGVWLQHASPLAAVQHSRVPALLIAGTNDRNIQMHNAQEIAQACGARCSLWIVQGADHGGATVVAPDEFRRRILDWFAAHE